MPGWTRELKFCPECSTMLPHDHEDEDTCDSCGNAVDPVIGLFDPDQGRRLYQLVFS